MHQRVHVAPFFERAQRHGFHHVIDGGAQVELDRIEGELGGFDERIIDEIVY
jgi:hypothetical protein